MELMKNLGFIINTRTNEFSFIFSVNLGIFDTVHQPNSMEIPLLNYDKDRSFDPIAIMSIRALQMRAMVIAQKLEETSNRKVLKAYEDEFDQLQKDHKMILRSFTKRSLINNNQIFFDVVNPFNDYKSNLEAVASTWKPYNN
jgi:hypothetical protein